MLLWILLIFFILVAVGGLPTWPYMTSYNYGYAPSGLMVILIVVVIILILNGRL